MIYVNIWGGNTNTWKIIYLYLILSIPILTPGACKWLGQTIFFLDHSIINQSVLAARWDAHRLQQRWTKNHKLVFIQPGIFLSKFKLEKHPWGITWIDRKMFFKIWTYNWTSAKKQFSNEFPNKKYHANWWLPWFMRFSHSMAARWNSAGAWKGTHKFRNTQNRAPARHIL